MNPLQKIAQDLACTLNNEDVAELEGYELARQEYASRRHGMEDVLKAFGFIVHVDGLACHRAVNITASACYTSRTTRPQPWRAAK